MYLIHTIPALHVLHLLRKQQIIVPDLGEPQYSLVRLLSHLLDICIKKKKKTSLYCKSREQISKGELQSHCLIVLTQAFNSAPLCRLFGPGSPRTVILGWGCSSVEKHLPSKWMPWIQFTILRDQGGDKGNTYEILQYT